MKILTQVRAEKCELCGRVMIPKAPSGIYANYFEDTQEEQAKRKKLQFISDIKVDGKYICQDCADKGKADFLCVMCKERKQSDKKEISFGDPKEYLCTDCYETVPAKDWDLKVDEMENLHRWDYE